MTRILIVEDLPHRRTWFRHHCPPPFDLTDDAAEAIAWLQAQQYAILWLDHDLGPGHPPGRAVSDWLIQHPAVQPQLVVRVHSVNPISGPKIVQELAAAGRPVKSVSFMALAATPALLAV